MMPSLVGVAAMEMRSACWVSVAAMVKRLRPKIDGAGSVLVQVNSSDIVVAILNVGVKVIRKVASATCGDVDGYVGVLGCTSRHVASGITEVDADTGSAGDAAARGGLLTDVEDRGEGRHRTIGHGNARDGRNGFHYNCAWRGRQRLVDANTRLRHACGGYCEAGALQRALDLVDRCAWARCPDGGEGTRSHRRRHRGAALGRVECVAAGIDV